MATAIEPKTVVFIEDWERIGLSVKEFFAELRLLFEKFKDTTVLAYELSEQNGRLYFRIRIVSRYNRFENGVFDGSMAITENGAKATLEIFMDELASILNGKYAPWKKLFRKRVEYALVQLVKTKAKTHSI